MSERAIYQCENHATYAAKTHATYLKLQLLSAGTTRVTPDKRVSVIHDEGGDVYVLSISGVNSNDSGTYMCEVNTDPPTRSFHNLQGIPSSFCYVQSYPRGRKEC